MTKRMFVCHAKSAIESTSEVVDVLESALDFSEGSVLTSSLPGYASALRSDTELRAVLAGTHLVLALVSEESLEDPAFNFELGAAWALGIDIVPVLLGNANGEQLPWPVRGISPVEVGVPDHWPRLAFEVATRLGVGPREPEIAAQEDYQSPAVSDVAPVSHVEPGADASNAYDAGVQGYVPLSPAASEHTWSSPGAYAAQQGYGTEDGSASAANADYAASSYGTTPGYAAEVAAVAQGYAPAYAPEATRAPQPFASAQSAESARVERTAYVSDVVPAGNANDFDELQPGQSSVSIAPVVQVSLSEAPSSAVFARLPTCESAFEVGRAVSDCVFNRAEISDPTAELNDSLGSFVDAIGGSWEQLSSLRDLDAWLGATENMLAGLPVEARRIADWYQLGFELATLHNLAGQLVFDAPERMDEDEAQWRTALDRFLSRAESAQIGYEELGRVLSLLENLAGPRAERDLANIGRSLTEVRRHAAGADGIHTAA